MKKQMVIGVYISHCNPLENVNIYLKQGWLVKKAIVISENLIHYLLEKEMKEAE